MAELVDAADSKSVVFGRAGSIPARGTKLILVVMLDPDAARHPAAVRQAGNRFCSEFKKTHIIHILVMRACWIVIDFSTNEQSGLRGAFNLPR